MTSPLHFGCLVSDHDPQDHDAENQCHKHRTNHRTAMSLVGASLAPLSQDIACLAVYMGLFLEYTRDGLREGFGLLRSGGRGAGSAVSVVIVRIFDIILRDRGVLERLC